MKANNQTLPQGKKTIKEWIDPSRLYKTAKRTSYLNTWCRNGCNTQIHFDEVFSPAGKMVPLEDDDRPHNCPEVPWNRKRSK